MYVCTHWRPEVWCSIFFFYHSIYPFEIRSLNSAALAGHWTLQTHLCLHPINSWERTYRYIHSLRNWVYTQYPWVSRPAEGVRWPGAGSRPLWAHSSRQLVQLSMLSAGIRAKLSSSGLCLLLTKPPWSPCFRSLVKVWSVSFHRLFFVPPGFDRQAAVTTLETDLPWLFTPLLVTAVGCEDPQ